MQSLLQDVRYGGRMMRRNPGFTLAAVLTLALGIGANSAIFSLVNVLSLKPLPYADPARVMFVLGTDAETGETRFAMRVAEYLDIERQAQSFEQVAAYTYLSANLTGGDLPERVQAYRVTANTFALLGVQPAVGRVLTAADTQPGGSQVVVISDGLWRLRFGADPSIVGRTVTLNGTPHEIVGVMPSRFEFPVFNFKGDLWVPWTIDATAAGTDRAASGMATVVARLKKDVPPAQAATEVRTIMQRLATAHPVANASLGARVVEMGRLDDEQAGPALLIVMVTVALVLLLACANVANLLLARGVTRSRELAVRAAVGASRWRIARQLVVESLMLALCGAVAGVFLAKIALDALRSMLPEMILTTVPNVRDIGIDRVTLLFTLLLAGVTSLIFGVMPALRAARPQLQESLKEGTSSGGTRGTRRLRSALVVVEVALATLLLVSAGLLVRSYAGLQRLSPGFTPGGLLTMTLTLPEDRYASAERHRLFFEDAVNRVAQIPGVSSAAFVNVLPFSTYDRGTTFIVDGAPLPQPGREPAASLRIATPGYFATMEIPVVAGRAFDARDRDGSQQVGIVNRAFVRRFFGNADPVGRRLRPGDAQSTAEWIMVVGVVGDVHHWQLTQAPDPELYLPFNQAPRSMMMLAARTGGRPEDLVSAVRGKILEIDPLQPVYHVKPMVRLLDDALLPSSTSAALMAIFSGLALLLAIVGVYGVVSYGVSQQMPEFGLRLALGATPGNLVRLVIRRGGVMVCAGVAIGIAASAAASGVLGSLLYGVTGVDPFTYVAVAGILTVLGIGACVIPAWRASSAEPLSALRSE